MKKVLVILVLLVASTFFSLSVFADNMYQQPMAPYSTVSVVLSNGYQNVTLEPGEAYKFNWSVSNLNSNRIFVDSISSVDAGSSSPQVIGTVYTSGNGGTASFLNISDSTLSGLNLSISASVTAYNQNDTYQTPRLSLSCSNGSVVTSSYISNATLNAKLNQILSALGKQFSGSDFLGSDAMVYFREDYFPSISSNSGTVSYQNGLAVSSGASDIRFGTTGITSAISDLYFDKGLYYFVLSVYGKGKNLSSINIAGASDGDFELGDPVCTNNSTGISFFVIPITFDSPFVTNAIRFIFDSSINGAVYGGLVRASIDDQAQGAINPSQDQMVDDVDKAGEDQAAQEEQMWSNINTYKGSLDFSLSGWDDASSGLSYVRDVFMIIWDNSPTEIITLSLMLGIAMLSIGRGVGAAVRVSSRRRGDD